MKNIFANSFMRVAAVAAAIPLFSFAAASGKTVAVENTLGVPRHAETVRVAWGEAGAAPGDADLRVVDKATGKAVPFQDDGKGGLIFSVRLGPGEKREYGIVKDAKIPQADMSVVCRSEYLPERMDDFAWENDCFGARAYGPVIMEPAPKGQRLVSSGIDVINKCVPYPVLRKWFVENKGKSYHKNWGEGMDNYKVSTARGCGGIGSVNGGVWAYSRNWSKCRTLMNGPVRTVFELTYPAWGGFGEETRRVTLDRGRNFARFEAKFAKAGPAGAKAGPGLDCSAKRHHNGEIVEDLALGYVANWEPDGVDGADNGSIATAILLDPVSMPAEGGVDGMDCRYLFANGGNAGFAYWAGSSWSGAGRVKSAAEWHKLVKEFALSLRNPVKVTVK